MVTVFVSGNHDGEIKDFEDLDAARDWIYSENRALSENVWVLDEMDTNVFETDGTEIRWHQIENKLGPYSEAEQFSSVAHH